MKQIGRISFVVAVLLSVATPAMGQAYRSRDEPLTATHNGNDVAYLYGWFTKESYQGDLFMRNDTRVKNPDLAHSVFEETDYYWMNSDGDFIDGEVDQSPKWQQAGWQEQYDHAKHTSDSYAYGDMETAVMQDLNFRPNPTSPVEPSKNFWF